MPYDLFISYSRRDDENGCVSQFVRQITRDFELFAGRRLTVFFDNKDIQGMDDWRQKIQQSLRTSHLFIAALSPNYLESSYCRWEWEDYVRYEAMRQCLGEGIAPVLFVTLPDAVDTNIDQVIADWIKEIQNRQVFDLRPWHVAGENALEQAPVKSTLEQLRIAVRERLDRTRQARHSPHNLIGHNPAFVGRSRELSDLRSALVHNKLGIVGAQEAQVSGRATVQGLGGMGKTELALAYAHAFAWDYPGGRWQIGCEHIRDLRLALLQLASPLKFEFTENENKSLALAYERVLRELDQRQRCLILLDNVNDPGILEPEYLDRLPRDGRIDIIATTRLAPRNIPGSAQGQTFIVVDELPEEDALALLRSHQPKGRFPNEEEDNHAREIVRLLEGFTLAVETAAIYLGRYVGEVTCKQFLRDLRARLLEHSEVAAGDSTVAVRHRERLLENTLAFTLATLPPEAHEILQRASLLPADQVAIPWLRVLGKTPDMEFGNTVNAASFDEQIDLLIGVRLFQRSEVVDAANRPLIVRIHRLVQSLLLTKLHYSELTERQRALQALVEQRDAALEKVSYWKEAAWEVEPLSALACSWADSGHPRSAWLLSQVGLKWNELAKWSRAEPLLRRALAIDQETFGPSDLSVAIRLTNLGQVLRATSQTQEAEFVMRRALAIAESALRPDHFTVALRLNNLGQLLHETGRLTEAEALLRRALATDEQTLGAEHPNVARDCSNLAMLLFDANRLADAEKFVRRAITISLDSHGFDSDTARYAGNLARILSQRNRFAEAEPVLRRTLKIYEESLGTDHPRVATTLNSLAAVLTKTGRRDEAETLMRRALEIDERCFGTNHPEVATDLGNLGQFLQESSRFEEAEHSLRRALAIDEANLHHNHPSIAACLNNLAIVLERTGRSDEAEHLMLRSLAIEQASRRPDHPLIALRLNNLAAILHANGRMSEALPLYRKALAIHERNLQPDDPDLALTLNNLACILRDTEQPADAIILLERAIRILLRYRAAAGHIHSRQAITVMNYFDSQQRLGRSSTQIVEQLNAISRPFGYLLVRYAEDSEKDGG